MSTSSNTSLRTRSAWALGLAASVAFPISGAAQTPAAGSPAPDTEAECAKLLSAVQNDCDERDKIKAELVKLAPPAAPAPGGAAPAGPPNPENERQRSELLARLAQLEASPFDAWCGGWSTANMKSCDALATLL